jgi:hypothetical protein
MAIPAAIQSDGQIAAGHAGDLVGVGVGIVVGMVVGVVAGGVVTSVVGVTGM